MCYLDATPLLKLTTHLDFCYVYSSLELPDVYNQAVVTYMCPSYLTSAPVAVFLLQNFHTLSVATCGSHSTHCVGFKVFAGRAFAQIQNFLE